MASAPLSLLFDLDGTLVDSKPGILASCEAAMRALGHRPDGLDIDTLIGPPLETVMAEVLGRFGDDRVAEAVAAYREHYGSVGILQTTAYPGIAAALDDLVAARAGLYIATSKRTLFAKSILETLGLMDRFAGVCGSEPGGGHDSKAEVVAEAMRRHALRPDRCVMVGDRQLDVEGARANGVPTVGVLWGYGDRAELMAAGAARLIATPAELISIAQAEGAAGPP